MTFTTHKTLEAMLETLKQLKQDLKECHPNKGAIQLKSYVRWVNTIEGLTGQVEGIIQHEVPPRVSDVKRDKRAQAQAQAQEAQTQEG